MRYTKFYPTDVTKNGAIRSNLHLVTVTCSTPAVGTCMSPFNLTDGHWRSENDPKAFFQVTFQNWYLFPKAGALFSCITEECIYNFSIYGIQKGKSTFEKICDHEGPDDEFFNTFNDFECSFSKPLSSIRLVQRGTNDNGSYVIPLYEFDFYGLLSMCHTFESNKIMNLKHIFLQIFIISK